MSQPIQTSIEEQTQVVLDYFLKRGAVRFDTHILQPAGSILDLYGEDIRSRAFITEDSAHGELILRPDFTVPLAKFHMDSAKEVERYAYCGSVFRRQWPGSARPDEYLQVGYEMFGNQDKAKADAEIFCAFDELLKPCGLRPSTGDLNILTTAVESLTATDRQKAALKRHLWRPAKFRHLLESYRQGRSLSIEFDESAIQTQIERAGAVIGQRNVKEVIDNVQAKIKDAGAPVLDSNQLAAIDDILKIKGTMENSLRELRRISKGWKGIRAAVDGLEIRRNELQERGIDTGKLRFEANYGRTSLEYYDGFVFGFMENGQPAALGGRYDFLTEALGKGRKCPAVGGMLRPGLVASLQAGEK